ncbi:MAG: cation-transporting P-type ATPase, partial [Sphingobacteriaceae bacterium]
MEQSNHQGPSHLQDIASLLSEFGVDDPARGLDAEQAKTKLEEFGYNRLKEKKRKSLVRIFLSQLNDALIYVLLIAVAITMFMGEYTDGVIILAVVFLNAVLGVIQEIRAGNAIDALRKMSQPQAYVKRDGQLIEIDSELLVPGDIVQIEVGSYVPADLRLLET